MLNAYGSEVSCGTCTRISVNMDTGDDDEAPPLVQTGGADGSVDAQLESQVGDLSLVKVPITIVTGECESRCLAGGNAWTIGENVLSDAMLRKSVRHSSGRAKDILSSSARCG